MDESIFDNYWIILLILLAVVWEFFWKALALWQSARRDQKEWFVAILLVNSLGILPIIYILMHQKKNW
ncbi:DUF5652 family protein [Litoribacter populi]|uniref:DUF5652 family protein n=1 Tax=Litoribacter populi TaxID=2598460 RepID=UPI00117C80F6|nr:DUF5652 family protein [Litoribacter populi]